MTEIITAEITPEITDSKDIETSLVAQIAAAGGALGGLGFSWVVAATEAVDRIVGYNQVPNKPVVLIGLGSAALGSVSLAITDRLGRQE